MGKININDCIKVKLTPYGYDTHIRHYKKYLGDNFNIKLFSPCVDEEGYTRYQLWDFMNIFGEYMYNGSKQIIENNMIYYPENICCKDCGEYRHDGYCERHHFDVKPDWFCADGECKESR